MTNRQGVNGDPETVRATASTQGGAAPGWFQALKWKGLREQDRRNEKRTNAYAFAWVGTLISANAIKAFTQIEGPIIWLVVLISVIPGTLFVKSYLKMLREADEMLRMMQLEAMSVGFGAGFVGGMTAMFLLPPSPLWGLAVLIPMLLGFCTRVILAGREVARDTAANADEDME